MQPSAYFEARALEYPVRSAPHELAASLGSGNLTPQQRSEVTARYGLEGDQTLHRLLLDWVLDYVRVALAGQPLAQGLAEVVRPIKHALGIREGDFIRLRHAEVKALVCEQLDTILEDGLLEDYEELAQVALQGAFDLGYDEYLALTRPRYERAFAEIKEELAGASEDQRRHLLNRMTALRSICELAVRQPRSLGGLR